MKLTKIEAQFQAPRLVINAEPGWGKTTLGAFAPKPALLMADNETGYVTLLGSGLVPSIDTAVVPTWEELLATLHDLKTTDHKTIVLDALSGFEHLCQVHVCNKDYKGDWSEKGFMSYMKGYDDTARYWRTLLQCLDELHAARKMIIILSHSTVKNYRNPSGSNYDRFQADCHYKVWGPTSKWADGVLFGRFRTIIRQDKGVAKGLGGDDRVLLTTRSDAYEAKNRWGMPEEIDMPDDPSQMFNAMWQHIYKPNNTQSDDA